LLKQSFPVKVIAVGSDAADRKTAKASGADYIQVANRPLSNKFRSGVLRARDFDPRAVMICGSDAWVSQGWVETLLPIAESRGMVGKRVWHTVYLGKDKIVLKRFGYPYKNKFVGNGVLYSSQLLKKMKWCLYPKNLNKRLDAASQRRARKMVKGRAAPYENDDVVSLSIKGNWETINPWKRLVKSKHLIIANERMSWIEAHFPGQMAVLKKIRRSTWGLR